MLKYNLSTEKQIRSRPETREVYNQLMAVDARLKALGWMEYAQALNTLLQEQEKKAKSNPAFDPKAKRNLFVQTPSPTRSKP